VEQDLGDDKLFNDLEQQI